MKKIMVTVVLVAFTAATQAQFAAGGQFHFSTSSTTERPNDGDEIRNPRTTTFTIAPLLARKVVERTILGVHPEFTQTVRTTFNYQGTDNLRETSTGFGLSVFALYSYMAFGRINLLAKPSIGFNTKNIRERIGSGNTDHIGRVNTLGFSITPVIDFHINERIMLIARLNFMSLRFSHEVARDIETDDRFVTNSFGFNVDNFTIANLGATPGFTIGFLYKF